MSYKSVLRKDHSVDQIISSVNFEKEVFEKVDRGHFVEGLAEFLMEAYPRLLDSKKKRSDAFDKAKKIYMGRIPPDIKERQAKELVKEAISNGYIWKFRLEQPWHLAAFQNDDMATTVPWQHKYAVLYTGRHQYELWTKRWLLEDETFIRKANNHDSSTDVDPDNLEETLHNATSILRQGYIEPGTKWSEGPEDAQERVKKDPDHTRAWAVYLSVEIKKPQTYAGGTSDFATSPVYEVEAPTNLLRVPYKPPDEGKMFATSLKEYFKEFDSPKAFVEDLFDSGAASEVQFHKNSRDNPNNFPVLPLDYINGVWDLNVSDSPYFMPLQKYVKRLYSKVPERLPKTPDGEPDVNLSIGIDVGKHERENYSKEKAKEADKLEFIETQMDDKIKSSLVPIEKDFYELANNESLDPTPLDRNQTFKHLVKKIVEYDENLEYLESEVSNDHFTADDLNQVDPLKLLESKELEELENLVKKIIKEAQYLRKEILGQAHEMSHKDEKELEKKLKNHLHSLPLFIINKQTMEELVEELAMNKSEAQEFRQKVKEKLG